MLKKLIILILLCVHSSILSMQLDISPDETPFDPMKELGIVCALSHSRVQWFDKKLALLSDTTQEETERLKIATKILSITLDQIDVSKAFSKQSQIKIKKERLLGNAFVVLEFSKLFWCYFERTINYYLSTTNGSIDNIKAVLPHLSKEMKNFEEFALGDLKTDSKNSYFGKELLYAQKILDILGNLGEHFHMDVAKKAYVQDMQTNEILEYTPQLLETSHLHMDKKSLKTSSRSVYFMEQLISFRKTSTYYDNPINRVNYNDPKINGFQQYILLPSGPTFIQEVRIPDETLSVQPKVQEKHKPAETGQVTKSKQKKSGRKMVRHNQQSRVARSFAIEKQTTRGEVSDEDSSPIQSSTLNEESELKSAGTSSSVNTNAATTSVSTAGTSSSDIATLRDKNSALQEMMIEETPSLISLPKLSYASVLGSDTTSSRITPVLAFTTLQPQAAFLKETRLSKSYNFNGQEYSLDLFAQPCEHFNIPFLEKIKQHTFRFSSGFPNLVKASLDLHYQVAGVWYQENIYFQKLFLSGGKSFDNTSSMPKTYNIFTATDLLTDKEKKMIPQQERGKKSTYVGICLEHQLLSRIGQGHWGRNHAHSESVYALWLLNELPTILKAITKKHGNETVNIRGLVSALQSFQDCCSDCQDLMQCLQGRMKSIITNMRIPNIVVENNFGTLMLVAGYTRAPKNEPKHVLPSGPINFMQNSHELVCEPFKLNS